MIKSRINIILILFVVLFGFYACTDDDSNNKINDNTEDEYILQEYFFPEELIYNKQFSDDFLYDKFYPIGWSKNGHFAYFTEYADEGIGGYMVKIEIINLVNDKVEWNWETPPDDDNYREEVWKDNYETFKEKLNEYEIIQKKDMEFGEVYFTYKGKEFNIELKTKKQTDPDYGFDVIVGTEVFISSPQLGRKKVYSYTEKEYSMILSQMIAGYIMSPYEDRILIFIKNERWGWEGIPSVVYFTLTGSNLNTGFQAETN